jgi:peptidoglycan/xylan/chitin deacetylase (PgdA/CDA1 family)
MTGHRSARRLALAAAAIVLLGVSAAFGAVFASHWRAAGVAECGATVLMFHSVVPDSMRPARYWMRESEFVRQLDELRQTGARTRPLEEFLQAINEGDDAGCRFDAREVVLTFDLDGPSWHHELAVPHLESHGFHAVFFVPTGFVGRGGSVTEEAIAAMAGGIDFGSHSEYHEDLRTLQPDSLVASLSRSREFLREITGQEIQAIAAPGGRYDDSVIEAVRSAGFSALFNSDPCRVSRRTSAYSICRIEIRGDGGMTAAGALLSNRRVAAQATSWSVKRSLEAVAGSGFYTRLNRFRQSLQGPGS